MEVSEHEWAAYVTGEAGTWLDTLDLLAKRVAIARETAEEDLERVRRAVDDPSWTRGRKDFYDAIESARHGIELFMEDLKETEDAAAELDRTLTGERGIVPLGAVIPTRARGTRGRPPASAGGCGGRVSDLRALAQKNGLPVRTGDRHLRKAELVQSLRDARIC